MINYENYKIVVKRKGEMRGFLIVNLWVCKVSILCRIKLIKSFMMIWMIWLIIKI